MQTKLTLRLDDELIRRAKRAAARSGKSVSALVADYLTLLDAPPDDNPAELTPRVRGLLGALAGHDLGIEDYRRHLEEKHA